MDGFTLVTICWRTYSSTADSEYISNTKGAAHALEVRSGMVEYGWRSEWCVKWTPRRLDGQWPRDVVSAACVHLDARLLWLQQLCAEGVVEVRAKPWRAQRGRLGNKDGRFEANDFAFERNTFLPPMGWSSWMVATTLTAVAEAAKGLPCVVLRREEHVRDEWLVLDLCGDDH